ncbi:hypothetical protein HYX02_02390 [Candidatus Woesearchaeota archaeon]|nr:hypothetical protein [Candidatus Woesearchaeota archaeon]
MTKAQRRPIDEIVRAEWGKSPKDRQLFNDTWAVIRGGVGEEFAEENRWIRDRTRAQHRLEHREPMSERELALMVASRDGKGKVHTNYRHETYVGVRDGEPKEAVYGSLLDVDGEPMMFMGYAARKRWFRDPKAEDLRGLLSQLMYKLNEHSKKLYGKPIRYVAIEIEPHQGKDIPLARWAMEELGAYPLDLGKPGYTQPGIDFEEVGKAGYKPEKLLLLFGDLRRKATRGGAKSRTYNRDLLLKVVEGAILDKEYREFSKPGPAWTRETSPALQNFRRSIEGNKRIGYDLSQLNWIYRK